MIGVVSPQASVGMSEDKSAYELKSELDGEFGSDGGDCLIVVDVEGQARDLFTAPRPKAVREITRRVEALGIVENVVSLENVKSVNWLGLPSSLMPRSGAGDEILKKYRCPRGGASAGRADSFW